MKRIYNFPNVSLVYWKEKDNFCVYINDWNFELKGCDPVIEMIGKGKSKQDAIDDLFDQIDTWLHYQEINRTYFDKIYSDSTYEIQRMYRKS